MPGIAGIILGIGFGVDANILINERIREEAKKGLSAFAALDNGFKRAYSTIVDANVTSLIATSLLFMFGSGPVTRFRHHHVPRHLPVDVHGGLRHPHPDGERWFGGGS